MEVKIYVETKENGVKVDKTEHTTIVVCGEIKDTKELIDVFKILKPKFKTIEAEGEFIDRYGEEIQSHIAQRRLELNKLS